uniref:Tripartite motif-containing protein 2 n=1 Tax=Magallana gigas TaxID=29159 RepID=K1R2I8_MAGGI
MSELVIKTEEPERLLINEPKVISVTETEFGESKKLHSVACLSQEEVWACGQDNMIRLYNLKGELVKAIHTKSGNNPENITVTRNGDLLYTDVDKRTVNIVKNSHIQKLLRLRGWRPFGVTSTSSGDLLVAMDTDDYKHSRIVRYSGSLLLNCIEVDEHGQPLFSPGRYIRYISENKNHDICVSDWYAGAVVVVNQAGKHRFTYTGPPTKTKGSLYPYGITTDSQSRILIADDKNNCIHIIGQDGKFLRFIDNCDLHSPWGLCVDTNDNLFVAEKEVYGCDPLIQSDQSLYCDAQFVFVGIVKYAKVTRDEAIFRIRVTSNLKENEITRKVSEITQTVADLKKLLNTNDFSQVSAYKSMNAEFRKLPPQTSVSLPSFTPQTINREQIHQQFGFMSELVIKTEEPERLLINEPKVISVIETEFGESKKLHSVACLSQEEVWACGQDNMIRLYNLKGELVKAIHTKSRNNPENVTVTRNGDLLYTDADKRSVNIVKHLHIQKIIKCWGWRPFGVTSTSSGDLLVAMDSDDYKHTRIVRYSGSILLNCIEIADNGQPLFSSGRYIRYINENKNHDICVSDWYAGAVVVVNPTGKLRFNYTGPPSKTKGSLYPYGITTDSQSRILIADDKNNCIHIIDQDGWFLRFIDNCDLHSPWGLCVDTNDNLFVAEKEGWNKLNTMQNFVPLLALANLMFVVYGCEPYITSDQTVYCEAPLVSRYSSPNRLEIYEYFEATLENLNRFSKFDCSCKVEVDLPYQPLYGEPAPIGDKCLITEREFDCHFYESYCARQPSNVNSYRQRSPCQWFAPNTPCL